MHTSVDIIMHHLGLIEGCVNQLKELGCKVRGFTANSSDPLPVIVITGDTTPLEKYVHHRIERQEHDSWIGNACNLHGCAVHWQTNKNHHRAHLQLVH